MPPMPWIRGVIGGYTCDNAGALFPEHSGTAPGALTWQRRSYLGLAKTHALGSEDSSKALWTFGRTLKPKP
jgi:hypothetical protein